MTAPHLPGTVRSLLRRLEEAGFEAYAVGGCVRDMLRGETPNDWDICSSALPEQVRAVFAGERVADTGIKHGTVTVVLEGESFEITTFRTESGYSDSRRPDSVSFVGSLAEDLSRRDFTVNAMAYSKERGLTDLFGGKEDLERRLIRYVGDPDARFSEDALRILRALRFASRLGFDIEDGTAAALVRQRGLLNKISAERVFSELCGILRGPGAGEMLARFPEVFAAVLPECARAINAECAAAVGETPDDSVTRLAMLISASGADADALLRRLKSDNETRLLVSRLTELAALAAPSDRFGVRLLLSETDAETAQKYLDIRRALGDPNAERAGERLRSVLSTEGRVTLRELAIGGDDLIALGVPRGRDVGDALRGLLLSVLSGETPNERAALLGAFKNKRRGTV